MKHAEKKKFKISNILLLLLVVVAIVLIIMIAQKYTKRNENEKAVQEVVAEIESIEPTSEENDIPYMEYEGYQVIGTVQISKIGIKYPILATSTEESLQKSITRVGDGLVNEEGNLTLAGHNFIDGSMFGKIDKLEKEDKISITDLHGNEVTYVVFDKYVTDPNDVSVLESIAEGRKEITLVTCINGNKNRLIIKAREV